MSDKKKTIVSKTYSIIMKSTNGSVIAAIGNGASITINNRINVGGMPHYQCEVCDKLHPVGYKHQGT